MYRLDFLTSAVKELKKLDFVIQQRIKNKLKLFAQNPDQFKGDIKSLSGKFKNKFRLRIGRYRVVYQKLDDKLVILVVRIGHRGNVYQDK